MSSQTKLALKPSIRVAIFLSTPCIATLILILSAKTPILITIILACFHIVISYQFISKIALLSSPFSIISIHLDNKSIYLEDKLGRRFIAKPLEKNIIYPAFTLLSFECESVNNLSMQTNPTNKADSLNQAQTTEIITTDYRGKLSDHSIIDSLESIKDHIKTRFLSKNRRHLFICRYNAVNSSAFRRIRVWFKFNQ